MKTIGQIMSESKDIPVDPRSGEANLYHIIQMQMERIKANKSNGTDKSNSKINQTNFRSAV